MIGVEMAVDLLGLFGVVIAAFSQHSFLPDWARKAVRLYAIVRSNLFRPCAILMALLHSVPLSAELGIALL